MTSNPKLSDNLNEYKNHQVYKRLTKSGPKRILALDGGGIRGALSLGYLENIETLLRRRYKDDNLVLSHYFDLIGGTSTGSIIATLISLGNSIAEIKRMYFKLGEKIFTKKSSILNHGFLKYFLTSQYDHRYLEEELDEYLGDIKLGSDELRTGLSIFTKRADTFSIWSFHNHPVNNYYEQNKGLYLKDLIRASTAAPSYFDPKEITLKDDETAIFVDGGMSMVNNPSLMLFLMTTISGYGYKWKTGETELQIISVGTGYANHKVQGKEKDDLKCRKSIFWAPKLSDIFMADATEQNQLLLQYFSNPKIPERINAEANDLSEDLITNKPLLDYCRYNVNLDKVTIADLGFDTSKIDIDSIRKMDQSQNVETLYDIGKADADIKIKESHFSPAFDLE